MALPQVAIVGRPNVGKSSLFNWLAGRRIAIVDPTPGVTRDRLTTPIACADHYFELVDTGGMGIVDQDNLASAVEQQIHYAIEQAQLLLFVVDARAGLAPLDEEIAQKLRSVGRALLMVANKCDTPELEPNALEFHRLGFGEVLCVSAEQKRGKKELLAGIARPAEGAVSHAGKVRWLEQRREPRSGETVLDLLGAAPDMAVVRLPSRASLKRPLVQC